MRIKKGDNVKILYGKDKGKTGKVERVINEEYVVVENINVYKRHLKGDGQTRTSEIVRVTKPLPLSKVQLMDPNSDKPTRVRFEIDKEGNKKRIAVVSGKEIDAVVEAPVKTSSKSKSKKEDKNTKKEDK